MHTVAFRILTLGSSISNKLIIGVKLYVCRRHYFDPKCHFMLWELSVLPSFISFSDSGVESLWDTTTAFPVIRCSVQRCKIPLFLFPGNWGIYACWWLHCYSLESNMRHRWIVIVSSTGFAWITFSPCALRVSPSKELFRRSYFMGSLAEVNTVVGFLVLRLYRLVSERVFVAEVCFADVDVAFGRPIYRVDKRR